MNRLRSWLLLTLCVAGLLLVPMYGQKTAGTITGVVSDPSGAVVANAPVTVTNVDTGLTRTTSTDTQGLYTFPELQPGTYRLNVKAANFKESVTNNVELHVSSIANVNVKLELGAATEQIEVNANTIQVQTDSAALGDVVDSTQVKELPLNGRSFVQLTQMVPGVSAANNFDSKNKGLQGGVDFSVNGNATTNNLYLIDGANNNDVGSNRTILIYPSVESIAEFKMLRNSFGPEYGQASGAVINIVTKNGTNDLHGSVFYAGRNDAVAAWNYFAKRAGKKDVLRRNDFGFTLGGPVKKDKLFFFYSEEWNRELRGVTKLSCVPTADQRAGDFSQGLHPNADGTMVDQCNVAAPDFAKAGLPTTAYSGYKLTTPLDPAGALLIQKYPLPNMALSGGNNWALSQGSKLNWREENARVDYNLNKANSLMFRFTQDSWENPAPTGGAYWGDDIFPTLNSSWTQPSKMIVGKWTSTIGSSMVNDAEFSYSNNRINVTAGGTDPSLLGKISAALPPLYNPDLKTAKAALPTIWGGFGNYGGNQNYWMQAPWNNTLDIYSFRDDMSKVSGNHTWKAGVYMGWDGKNEDNGAPGSERPTFSTTGLASAEQGNPFPNGTGNPLANVLTPGMMFNLSEVSTNVRAQMRWRDMEFYVGDTWKMRPNLTVEYGVRYSLLFSPFQAYGQSTSFQPALFDPTKPTTDACNGLWTVPGTDPCGKANELFGTSYSQAAFGPNKYLQDQNYHLFAPRFGISWDPSSTGNWAIRAGVGQFFQRERVSGPFYILAANAPFAVSGNLSRTLGGATPATLSGGASPAGGRDPGNKVPNSWQWNLTIEHSFAKDTALQIGYVGNSAIHQTSSYDMNQLDPSLWPQGAFLSGGDLNALRPFHSTVNPTGSYGQLAWWTHTGHASYHSLQTLFKTRYKRSQLTAAYTYSHSLSNVLLDNSDGSIGVGSFVNKDDPGFDRGNSPINRPHIFVANATFFLPELKGSNAFARHVAGGWELSFITQAASGAAHTAYITGISENTALTVDGVNSHLNNLIGTANNYNLRPLITGDSCTAGRQGDQLYNPSAFTLVGYAIGTLPSNTEPRGYCPGPRLVNTDLSINKNFKLTERIGMQLRIDLFDLLNHANFRGDVLNTNNPFANVNCGPVDANGKYAPCSATNNVISHQTLTNAFGQSTQLVGNQNREMQYTLKLIF